MAPHGAGAGALDDGRTRVPAGWSIIDDIRASLQNFEPRSGAEDQLYAKGLDQVEELADARRMRLVAAEEGIPGILWSVLISGG